MGGTSLTVLDSKGTQNPLQLESKVYIVLSQNVESIVSAMKVTVTARCEQNWMVEEQDYEDANRVAQAQAQ
jgi:hypothetical protein